MAVRQGQLEKGTSRNDWPEQEAGTPESTPGQYVSGGSKSFVQPSVAEANAPEPSANAARTHRTGGQREGSRRATLSTHKDSSGESPARSNRCRWTRGGPHGRV